MRYLITGGAGFIGSNIASKLADQGDYVRILDNFSTGKRENLESLCDGRVKIGLDFELTDSSSPFEFLGFAYEKVTSEITGGDWFRYSDVPEGLRGLGITFIVVGLMSLAFLGFSGIRLG